MPNECTARAGVSSSAPSMPSRPSRPRRRARRVDATSMSNVEPELEDVTVDHLVVLALDAELAGLPRLHPRPELEQQVPVDALGLDEPALEVGVDHTGALRRLGAGPERPRPALLLPGGEERAPAEQAVGRADQ